MTDSNGFRVPRKVLSVAQENKYLGIFVGEGRDFSYFIMQVCCVYSLESPHQGDSYVETLHTIILLDREDILKLFIFASVPGAMINIHWLELPMSRTNFYGPKDIPAIEV